MTTVPFSKYASTIAGAWKLISWEMLPIDPTSTTVFHKPHGDNPFGRVVISQTGYVSAILIAPSALAPLEAGTGEWKDATDAEVLRIGRSLTSYGGPMTLSEREDGGLLWKTRVEIAHNPAWIGGDQIRLADHSTEDGRDFLTLQPVHEYTLKDGTKARAVLKWVKVGL
ncbi:hypothetical protein PV10_01068 [Exophiala mesophila]|uniref:Lipocalin-like domain-containing protein n=1 Tax=Exophiala mesophila TaxID=212818 RepID=A0A0D1Y9D6_EXOME|nr:uncharacterized protein PV10_01068 [Exophiala mesophila]KIV97306.1 hypothetical protein PV10_01068 [Exophiala mesophila]